MIKGLKLIVRFFIDQNYRENLQWMKYIAKKLSFMHQHAWTCLRYPGGIIVIIAGHHDLWLAFYLSVFFSLTDMFDGMVARYKNQQSGRFGALLDATADKCFALPLLYDWGKALSGTPYFKFEMAVMFVIEASNGLLWILEKKGFVKSDILYEHLWSGKVKFVLQILLIVTLWFANFIYPVWPYWANVHHSVIWVINTLAILSVIGKINRIRSLTSK